MVIKVGLNGFGRVGRVVFRTCLQNPDLEILAINDPAIEADYICYLIKFDSTHGKLTAMVSHTENTVTINGKTIRVFHEKLPTEIPWKLVGVQYVVEASGMFTNYERASGHLKSDTVKRVVVTAPSLDIPMIILGVNHHKLGTVQKVLSCGSSTLYCLAPIIKVLEDSFGVEEGFITSIHAMTPSLKPLDGLCLRGKHWRDHRSIHQNIIPASTGACKALGRIIPSVRDKMTGLAFRVPIVNVSVLDISVRLVKPTSIQDILQAIRNASRGSLRNILKISTEEAVSSDFNRDSHSCIVDGELSMGLNPNSYKIICWYENEYSYACRVLDSIFLSEKQLSKEAFLSSLTCSRPTSPILQNHMQQTDNVKRSETLQDKVTTTDLRSTPGGTNVTRVPSHHSRFTRSVQIRGLSPVRTTSPTNTPARKDSKTLKVRNDESGQTMFPRRENKSAFFQHFCSKTPKQCVQPDCAKAQERLEKVKVEFCKMVNITEDLLKKSCRQNSEAKILPVLNDNQDRKTKSENAVKSNPNDAQSIQAKNCLQVDKVDVIKGVNKINLSTTNSTADSLSVLSNNDFFTQLHKSPSNRHITIVEDNKTSSDRTHRLNKLDAIVESSNVSNYREYDSSDNADTIKEHLSDKSQLRSLIGNENYIRAVLRKAKNNKNENYHQTACQNAENIPPIPENQRLDDSLVKLSNKELSNLSINVFKFKSSFQAIEKELRKRNILLITDEEHKNKTKENASMNKVHRNPGVYCCQKSDSGYGDSNKLIPSSAHESLHKANSKYTSSLQGKFKTGNIASKREFQSNELEINKKVEDGNDADKPGGENHTEETKFEVSIDQKDSDYETDNFSVKTDLQKEKHFEIYSSRSNVFSPKTEDDDKENKCLNNNLLHEDNKSSTENNFHKNSDKMILLCDDSKSDFENYEHSKPRTGENPNTGKVEQFEHDHKNKLHEEDKNTMRGHVTSLEYEGYMTHADDRPGSLMKGEESYPSVYSSTSNPPSPHSTNKQDIFDKLDSVSATDSDCSDRIDGKKSQVIHITDLTNSLEDLERLDKICRIVEISDELSDKLFSRLDSGDSHTCTGKKWSFRDLCEKINLDEFCNKVFGQVEN